MDAYLLRLYREENLFYKGPPGQDPMTRQEIEHADTQGHLIGTNGYATLFASCSQCDWNGHRHFEVDESNCEVAQSQLQSDHSLAEHGCKGVLSFTEESE